MLQLWRGSGLEMGTLGIVLGECEAVALKSYILGSMMLLGSNVLNEFC
jgi:hypothetical protein